MAVLRRRLLTAVGFAVPGLAAFADHAAAQTTYTWNPANSNGTFLWNSAVWSANGNAGPFTSAWDNGSGTNVANLSVASGNATLELTAAIRAARINFLSDGLLIQSMSGFSFDTPLTLFVDGNYTATIAANLAGNITKSGTGTLFLSGANSFTASATIQGGTVILGCHTALGVSSAALSMLACSTVDLNGFSPQWRSVSSQDGFIRNSSANNSTMTFGNSTLVNMLIGASIEQAAGLISIVHQGAGNLTLTGNNTYTGLTTVTMGNLVIGSGGTSGSILGNVDLVSSTSLLQFTSPAPPHITASSPDLEN